MHLLQECCCAFIFTRYRCSLKMFFDDGVRKAVTKTNVTLSRVTTHVLRCISRKACPPWVGLTHIPHLRAAEVCWKQWPCPKPRQTDIRIPLPIPKVCLNLIYPRCGSQRKGNAARLGSKAVCCLVVGEHYGYDLGFCAACEVFCNPYCEKW